MFDKLKKFFVVTDDEFKKQAQAQKKTESSSTSEDSNIIEQDPIPDPAIDLTIEESEPSGSQKPDEKFLDILLGAIEKQNQSGFDYLEYKQSLQNLEDIDMDEGTRYNSAMAMAKTMGSDPASITKSANFYLNVLKKEKEKFSAALASKQQKLEENQVKSIKAKQDALIKKQQQIQQLQQEIAKLEADLQKEKSTISTNKHKLESTNQKFGTAYQMIVGQISKDIEKVNQYVK